MAIYQGRTKISGNITRTSELTNDSDFTTNVSVDNKLASHNDDPTAHGGGGTNSNTYLQLYDTATGQAYILIVSNGVINLVRVSGGALSYLLINDAITGLTYNVQIENKLVTLTQVNGNGKGLEQYDSLYDVQIRMGEKKAGTIILPCLLLFAFSFKSCQ